MIPSSFPNNEVGRVDVKRAASELLMEPQRPPASWSPYQLSPARWFVSTFPGPPLLFFLGSSVMCCSAAEDVALWHDHPPSLFLPPLHPGWFIWLRLNLFPVFQFFISLIIVNLGDVLWLNFHSYSTFFLLFLNEIIASFLHLRSSVYIFCEFLILIMTLYKIHGMCYCSDYISIIIKFCQFLFSWGYGLLERRSERPPSVATP